VPAAALHRILGLRFIYDAHEDLQAQVQGKPWIPRRWRPLVAAISRMVEVAAGATAVAVVVATPSIAKKYPAKKTSVVRNLPRSVDFEAPVHAARSPRAVYVGGVDEARGGRALCEIAELLPAGSLVVAGRVQPAAFEASLREHAGWCRLDYRGVVSFEESIRLQRESTVGVVVLPPREQYIESLPTKLFEYMAAGLAVVASDFPLWRDIVSEAGCGLLVDPMDPSEVAGAVGRLLSDQALANDMGRRGTAWLRQKRSWETEQSQLLAVYSEFVAPTSGSDEFKN
jgi:glycosyltransferase involved in cell wall biosynthesis